MTPAKDTLGLNEEARKAQALTHILWVMFGLAIAVEVMALVDPENDRLFTVLFYIPIDVALLGLLAMVRRGWITVVAWGVSIFFWALTAFITLRFGGMQGHNAVSFAVVVMLVSSLVSPRAGILVAIGSAAWSGLIAVLETRGALPARLGPPYHPINAWSALAVSLVLVAVLMRDAVASLRSSHAGALAAAAERDAALRRSIQAQKMEIVGNLASGVAHDFNNLLTVITSVSDQLREEIGKEKVDAHAMLDDLDDASTRAILLTRQLLALARTQPSELVEVDLGQQVRDVVPMLQRLVTSKVHIEVEAVPRARVKATRAGIEQVLLNLAVNARDAMPEGGTLRFFVTADDTRVRLRVEDTGVGMDAETKERIFQPFFTTKATGTGLGLATVREKVEQFGGTISVASVPGGGTTFDVLLPPCPAVVQPTPSGGQRALPVGPASRILLVEDDPLVRRAMTRLLEHAAFEVVAVTNGAQALALLTQAHDFVCVVSDISMPVLDGEELAARLDELAPDLPLVLVSGDRVPASTRLGPRRAFLEKPVEREALLRAIAGVREAG